MRGYILRILVIALLICTVGIISIYSSTFQKEARLWHLAYRRQIFWVLLGILVFIGLSNLNYRRLWDMAYLLYIFGLCLLLLVFILGVVRLGAQRWLRLAWFNFQPSEAIKLIMIIFLARYFSRRSTQSISSNAFQGGVFRSLLIPFLFTALPVGLIVEQPDLGSGLMLIFIFIVILFLAPVRLKYLVIFFLMVLISLPLLWHFLRDYQKERLLVFLNPDIDPLGAGYTVIQSKIAIGSGGIFGKGWLSGTQGQLHFLPEAHTDFIFASFAEEWGLFGCSIVLLLYYLLIKQGISIALRTNEQFGRLLAFGITLMLATQVFINIAMTLGFAPVVGLPLPLMSYGGSSVLTTFMDLGILANIYKTRGVF
ncbi:MAG: rod shape-determining protein RodA [Candidatus Omnitrophica bacterium]|nr:rod shape-determining protein RodA [Candidatus Omnitrophota bacterium]